MIDSVTVEFMPGRVTQVWTDTVKINVACSGRYRAVVLTELILKCCNNIHDIETR